MHRMLASLCCHPSPAEWQPSVGEFPQGISLHPRTWVVLGDKHALVDGLLQEVCSLPE